MRFLTAVILCAENPPAARWRASYRLDASGLPREDVLHFDCKAQGLVLKFLQDHERSRMAAAYFTFARGVSVFAKTKIYKGEISGRRRLLGKWSILIHMWLDLSAGKYKFKAWSFWPLALLS